MSTSWQRTPLYEAHRQLGAKLIEFGGWEMPVQYTSIMDEHLAVRRAAGIFDISHMGEMIVSGPGALAFLNGLLTNDVRKLVPGWGQYTLMCNDRGGTIDDLYLYRLEAEKYLLIVNASRCAADVAWILARAAGQPDVAVEDASAKLGAVAVQGPATAAFIESALAAEAGTLGSLAKNQIRTLAFQGQAIHVARTGYTGEDGFEIVAPASGIEAVWESCLRAGAPHGLKPAGLGARDTLRTEVCYPLYGHELDEETSPIEAGVGFFVALDKEDFCGKATLAKQKAEGPRRRLVAFRMTGRSAPPRPDYPILSAGENARRIGRVTSGTQSPSLGLGIGLGYVEPEFAKRGTALQIEIRGKPAPAEVAAKPLYRKEAAPPTGTL